MSEDGTTTEHPSAGPERAVIGMLLHDVRALDDTAELSPEDFRDMRLGALYRLITRMVAASEPVDVTTVLAALPQITNEARGVDGNLLADLYTEAPVTQTAHHYARLVIDAATKRRLYGTARRIAQLSESADPAAELVEQARAELDAVHRDTGTTRVVADTIDETLNGQDAPATFIPTPWADLNNLIKGWRPGALYVVGARPGVGKTIVGVQAAIDLAARGGWVAFSSLEMPEVELHHRIIAQLAEVPIQRLDAHELTELDWQKIARVRDRLNLTIGIDDRGTVTVNDVRAHARTVARKGRLAGVVVDYLQLMSNPRGDRRPRHEIVAGYSRALKLLAKELNVPVIALSQLNRASEARPDRRPTLADLRESGAVEQDSDVVLLLHEDEDDETAIDMLVAKNRHGAKGPVELTRRGWYARLDPRVWTPHAPADPRTLAAGSDR